MPLTRPTTTPLPDEIYDDWAPKLGEAELKVLLYIVRRTLGFGKGADAISLTQFINGIVTRDGRVLDHGCGIKSRPNVVRALKGLDDKGLIHVTKGKTTVGDKDVTVYALRWEGDGEETAPAWGGAETTLPWCRSAHKVVLQEHYRGVAATPTRNSVTKNSQQDSETTRARTRTSMAPGTVATAAATDANPPRAAGSSDVVWSAVLDDLRTSMTAGNFAMWLADTRALVQHDSDLTVLVPHEAHRHWLDTHLRGRIAQSLARLGHAELRVIIAVAS